MERRFAINILCIPFFVLVVLLGCSEGSETYYSLREGMTWVYYSSISYQGGSVTNKLVVTNFASRELKGKKVTPKKCYTERDIIFTFLVEDNNGIYEFARQSPEDIEPIIFPSANYVIKYPIQVGTTWNFTDFDNSVTFKCTIEKIDEVVTVSAGTFKGCVMVKRIGSEGIKGNGNIEVEIYEWYAPGVGLIKKTMKQTEGRDLILKTAMQLESFK